MKFHVVLPTVLAILGFSTGAFADPVTYSLTATTLDGYALSGTFTLDSATDLVDSADIIENGNVVYNSIAAESKGAGITFAILDAPSSPGFLLLLGATAGANPVLCTGSCVVANSEVSYTPIPGLTFYDPLISGSITATPEPSSLMLLGTGVLGFAGAARRRFVR